MYHKAFPTCRIKNNSFIQGSATGGGSNERTGGTSIEVYSPNNQAVSINQSSGSCAPGVNSNGSSCLTKQNLLKIAQTYNQSYPNTQIRGVSQMDRNQLWKAIRDRLYPVCQESESCWVDQDFMINLGDDEVHNRFKPKRPKGKYQWLDTNNIQKTMEQYEQKYPDFAFIGPVPMNFSQLSSDIVGAINELDLAQAYSEGIRKIGIIFNLSPWHPGDTNSGSHWVSLWIDLKQKIVAYFDSFGHPNKNNNCIPAKIKTLINRIISRYPGMTVKCNPYTHQKQNSECGVYSMYFIKSALDGRQVDEIYRDIKSDEEMNQYRNVFFRP